MELAQLHRTAILDLTTLVRCARRSRQRSRNSLSTQQLNDQGLARAEQGKLQEAEAAFRQALEANLFYAPAHHNLALILLRSCPPAFGSGVCI